MFSKGPPGSRHLQIGDKSWQQRFRQRIESFLDQQYAAVDQDDVSDDWDILEVENWNPSLASRAARQARDARASDPTLVSTGVQTSVPFDRRSTGSNGDYDFESIWEMDGLDTSPVAGNLKRKMVADWLAAQRRKRNSGCNPDSSSAPRSDDLQHSQQEDEMLRLQHSLGTSRPGSAGVDCAGQLGGGGSRHEEDMDKDALPEGRSVDFVLRSNRSLPRRDTGKAAPQTTD